MNNMIMQSPNTLASTGHDIEKDMAADIAVVMETNRKLTEVLPIHQQTWIKRLFPDPVTRAHMKGRAKIQEKDMQFQLQALSLVREAQARVIQTVLTHLLREGKAGLQSRTASFVTDRQLELMAKIDDAISTHQHIIANAYTRITVLPTENMRGVELKRLEDLYQRLSSDVETIMAQYSEIVRETIPAVRE